jgi:hypothetical protein
MHYSRLQKGASCGENIAKFTSTSVHVLVAFPINSKPDIQVYVAVSSMELPVNDIKPLLMTTGLGHCAAEQEICELCNLR